MRRLASSFVLSIALGGSASSLAMAAEQPGRVYDQDHRGYHEWNDREDRAYRHWLEMNRKNYHDWKKAGSKEQKAYWKWRHEHPGEDWR